MTTDPKPKLKKRAPRKQYLKMEEVPFGAPLDPPFDSKRFFLENEMLAGMGLRQAMALYLSGEETNNSVLMNGQQAIDFLSLRLRNAYLNAPLQVRPLRPLVRRNELNDLIDDELDEDADADGDDGGI